MVRIKLKEIAEKLGKTILEIAEETGLNRNTITSLYHNKVDGIKFETIEKICSAYSITIPELIEMEKEAANIGTIANPYRQDGEAVLFTIWLPFYGINFGLGEMIEKHLVTYVKKGYGEFYWAADEMDKWARKIYARFSNPSELQELYASYLDAAANIEKIFLGDSSRLISLSNVQLHDSLKKILSAYAPFWDTSLFIDAFDAGFDQIEIKKIAKEHGFTVEETVALTVPADLSIDRERRLALLEIANMLLKKASVAENLREYLKDFVATSAEIKGYIRKYDYCQSNYGAYRPIKKDDVVAELYKFLSDHNQLKKEYSLLADFESDNEAKIKKVLRAHGLRSNPLAFFQKVTSWRESRKKFNLMGIVSLFRILGEVERRTGIPVSCLGYMIPDEFDSVIKGILTRPMLERRREEGVACIIDGKDYRMLYGKEAASLKNELDEKIGGGKHESILTGQVASQGYAKGIVCVVRTVGDFAKFKDGQILVAGMTRPEFVPLMKKAAGIVTNEGGITSHAAIVSRELDKPCVIGTKNATEFLHDGDLVEVRAMHGTVRVLERA